METLKSLMKKTSDCTIKRTYDVNTVISETAKHTVKVEAIVRDLIFKKLNNKISDAELADVIMHIYDDNDSIKGYAKELRAEELLNCLKRYFSSEKRIPMEAPDAILDIFDTEVDVNPDALFIMGDTIEAVKYFFKKPEITKNTESLSLYALLSYAKEVGEMMLPGKNVNVKASFYYLRKKNDKSNKLHPETDCFDLDFFDNKGANVVTLIDTNLGDVADAADRVTTLDARYYQLFKKFQTGIKKSYKAADCKFCSLKDVCSFHKAKAPIPAVPKGSTDIKYTDEQKAVIKAAEKGGLIRVNAGAGTGKTMTIAGIVVNLLHKGYKPEEIVVSTFTNASAKEMKERIELLGKKNKVNVEYDKLNALTFNALGDIYLKENYLMLGYTKEPTLIEDSEANKIIEDILLENPIENLNYSYLRMNEFHVKGGIAVTKDVFRVFKTYNILPKDLDAKMDFIKKKLKSIEQFLNEEIIRELYSIYPIYEKKLFDENLIDYTDQEMAFSRIDKLDGEYFKNTGFKVLIIDEGQDSNEAQLEIMKILKKSKVFTTLIIVGDDSQSIYGFRDASPYNLINFDKIMGEKVSDYYLTKNFRSTPEIIDLANKINNLNKFKIQKTLVSAKPSGKVVTVTAYKNSDNEYADIADAIEKLIKNGTKPEDIAFIARKSSELTKFQDYLDAKGIDSTILVPELLKENSRILSVMGLLKFLENEGDESGIVSYVNGCTDGEWFNLTDKQRTDSLKEFSDYAFSFREFTPDKKLEAFTSLVDRIPGATEDELFGSFIESLKRYKTWGSLTSYLYAFDVFGDNNSLSKKEKYSGVTLTTAHSSKGLEWPIVFNSITGYDKATLHDPENEAELEEERRLLFVSVTRARDELYISGKFYSFGNYGDATKIDGGENLSIFMNDLYKIYKKGDLKEALKKAKR